MFDDSAGFYDLIYGSFKDYAAEAVIVSEWIERYRAGAASLLDVACGTGEHARHLAARGFAVDGIDINPAFVRIAQTKVPTGRFAQADMSAFSLGRRYDAVVCLFSSIGYVLTLERLGSTLVALADHLDDHGVLLVEPWFTPGTWSSGQVHQQSASSGGVLVSRMGYSGVDGRVSSIRFEYLIGTEGQGIEHRAEMHELGLFTKAEMTDAFERVGLEVVYDPAGIAGRGLYIAKHRRGC